MACSEETARELAAVLSGVEAGEYVPVISIMRRAYDQLGEAELRHALEVVGLPASTGVSEDGWVSVAWSDSEKNSMFNLGAALWDADWREREALEVMRLAHIMGADQAGFALAEYLCWLREDGEAESILLKLIEDPDARPKARGLLGRLYFENQGRVDDQVLELLSADLPSGMTAEAYAKLLLVRGDDVAASEFLSLKSAEGEDWAPILLGNLRNKVFEDRPSAEIAYLRGIELGDFHSATNLGLMLMDSGEHVRALPWLEYARDRGDALAASILGQQDKH